MGRAVEKLENGINTLNAPVCALTSCEKLAVPPPGLVAEACKSIVVPVPTCRKLKSIRMPLFPLAVRSAESPCALAIDASTPSYCIVTSLPGPFEAVPRLKKPLFMLIVPKNPLAEMGFGFPCTATSRSRWPPITPGAGGPVCVKNGFGFSALMKKELAGSGSLKLSMFVVVAEKMAPFFSTSV